MTAAVRGETTDGFVASVADLNEIRATDPGRIRRQLATRRRRDLLGPDGRLMIVACDHPARGALGAGGNPMAMASRTELLARLVTALVPARAWTGCWPPPTSPRTCCCSARWRTRWSSPR